MLLNTNKFAFSMAIAASVLWAICSLLVILLPQLMTTMTEYMLHMDLPEKGLVISAVGFFCGLLSWALLAGGFGWLMSSIYNSMLDKPQAKK